MKRIAKAVGYIDEFIWLLIWVAGLGFVVIAILGGASVVEIGLLLVLTISAAARWAMESNVRDWLRGREP